MSVGHRHSNLPGANTPAVQFNAASLATNGAAHCGVQAAPSATLPPAPHITELATPLGSAHGFGAHTNVAGASVPDVHVSVPTAACTPYPAAHIGVHDAPDAMLLPSPHIAEFATVGSVHGSGLHVNVAGVSTAATQDSPVPAEIVYPAAHIGAHDDPDATLPPAPHIAEFVTFGSAHASGEHDGGIPVHVPAASHVYPAPLPTAVYPVLHITPTVHVDPTATRSGPHIPSSTLAEFVTTTPGPLLHTQCPTAPLHVPAIASHVNTAGAPRP
jgi:hypothetical protein